MIGSVTGAEAQAAGTAAKQGIGGISKDAFLQLLVAQLRYQNPLSPADGQQYIAQSAQFATVEKLDALAQAQAEMVGYQHIALATSMVGKTVTGTPPGAQDPVTGVVTAVKFSGGSAVLDLGGQELPLSAVDEVTSPAA